MSLGNCKLKQRDNNIPIEELKAGPWPTPNAGWGCEATGENTATQEDGLTVSYKSKYILTALSSI